MKVSIPILGTNGIDKNIGEHHVSRVFHKKGEVKIWKNGN